ncbi:MAG: hypothetical protein KZQ87_08845 [Candidatus Thiodiazotropha sp. (ex Cardiolucina cf. quadrata)]|nr:hypothetical protein [Candidatus Thiodiazotropha sp. (ex Cardiolucina cf. quadrata)]
MPDELGDRWDRRQVACYLNVMRKNMRMIFTVILMLGTPQVSGGKVPSELTEGLAEFYSGLLCSDLSFVKCAEINPDNCSTAVTEAIGKCDYSAIWKEIQRRDDQGEDDELLMDKGTEYGNCVNEHIKNKLRMDGNLYEQCLNSRFERYVNQVKEIRQRK